MSDTVGFIQQLPSKLIAAFRATLEEISAADLLIHVVDVSSAWAYAHVDAVESTLREIPGASDVPVIHAWNKIDCVSEEDAAVSLTHKLCERDEREGECVCGCGRVMFGAEGVLDLPSSFDSVGSLCVARDDLPPLSRVRTLVPPIFSCLLLAHQTLADLCEQATMRAASTRMDSVVVSAETGAGVLELLEAVESTLSLSMEEISVSIPYDRGDLLDLIHSQGIVEEVEYEPEGSRVTALIPARFVALFDDL